MRILNEVKPKYFLLENVEMGEKWEKILSKAIGVNGIHINSALVSAQNRKRIYWCNFGVPTIDLFGETTYHIPQPKDKGILLKDILESEVDEKYFLSQKIIDGFERHKDRHNDKGTGFGYVPKNLEDKGNSLRANAALCPTDNMLIVNNTNTVKIFLTSKDKRLKQTIDENNLKNGEVKALDVYNQSIHDRYPTLTDPKHNDRALFDGSLIRRLTPTECERLQTVKDGYSAHVSDSQRYKMLGNGWTIDVIAHIFSYIK